MRSEKIHSSMGLGKVCFPPLNFVQLIDLFRRYKRREKRGKKAYQELDVFMNEEELKSHHRAEDGEYSVVIGMGYVRHPL